MVAPQELPEPPVGVVFSHGGVRLHLEKIYPADGRTGIVPCYRFHILTGDGSDAGRINFRVADTDHVISIVGHIGYEIFEAHRGHGYALYACRAIAPFVRTFYSTVIITADPDNPASIRTIEKLGGTFLNEISVPPDDPHYQTGSRRKRRYCWKP